MFAVTYTLYRCSPAAGL